jgi:hypothetical protein
MQQFVASSSEPSTALFGEAKSRFNDRGNRQWPAFGGLNPGRPNRAIIRKNNNRKEFDFDFDLRQQSAAAANLGSTIVLVYTLVAMTSVLAAMLW